MLFAMDRYRLANRALWDEWTAINARAEAFYRLDEFRAGGVLGALTERERGRWRLPDGQELPLSFSLRATKPA